MRKLLFLSLLMAYVVSGCGLFKPKTGKNGELTGVTNRPDWDQPMPLGMLYIPPGTYHMGQNNQDVNYSQIAHNRQITISAFYMDETEVSNNKYRQFVDATWNTGYAENLAEPVSFADSVRQFLQIHLGRSYTDLEYQQLIYPDTIVWRRDFSYAYNEPLLENYFWHPAFDEYPVVGINWFAAQSFAHWRTLLYNKHREDIKKPPLPRFRLPTEAEWEYAARGGFEHKIYPWEGPYVRNSRGCFLANFKPGRGDYISDNFEYTCPVKSYWPNDYGLYCMPGNVSEWCEDDFEETGYTYAHDLNPVFKDPLEQEQRRVIRGGSWKDIAYFLSVGSRDYEYADTTKSFIGVRCVVSVLGRSGAAY
jgi:gliding motility-associated lipoprotein GldK